jgi:hypothetical protein
MRLKRPTRWEAIRSFGGALAAALLGGPGGTAAPLAAAEAPGAGQFIDAHFHLVNPRLPGVPEALTAPDRKTPLAPFDPARDPHGAQRLAKVIQTGVVGGAVHAVRKARDKATATVLPASRARAGPTCGRRPGRASGPCR